MSIGHTGDPNIKEGEFQTFTGTCTVNGIETFIAPCLNDGVPEFKEQGGKRKLGVILRRVDGAPGPAVYLTPAEYIALVRAFGVTDFAPDREQRLSPASILRGVELANKAARRFEVEVSDNWINRIDQLDLPEGRYTFIFKGAHRADHEQGNLHFFKTPNDSWGLWFEFEVVGDEEGNPCRWDGFTTSVFMPDVFVDHDPDGTGVKELGKPLFMMTGAGGRPRNAYRWEYFVRYFVPQITEDFKWQVDPANSRWDVCEVEQPQYVIINLAVEAKTKVRAYYGPKPKGKGNHIDLFDLPKFNTSLPQPFMPNSQTITDTSTLDLVNYIVEHSGIEGVFTSQTDELVTFSEAGREWAIKTLGPIYETVGIERGTPFQMLTSEQRTAVLDELKKLDTPAW